MLLLGVDTVIPLPSWFSLIIQGGSFALLTYIVVVMGPRWNKDSREEREKRDTQFINAVDRIQDRVDLRVDLMAKAIDEIGKTHVVSIRELGLSFNQSIKEQTAEYRKMLDEALKKESKRQ